ncbi:AcrR family transcriptional regulator [Streptosporangium becharense]|uniref:AcrR family transcriptional regulator n=1 Tax=Streptosporangium becharense TaxID=1816182 RepID=A0A7W9INK2_9ACTN|nr:TetR/AcrR family transcriptional regulator [Streptosporangium becharense]MBB2914313.1 AcrR family transcriptional regulator [Streptosporangium becharense]MBB5823655.1 AcrR family transcriptional regulator [Streptosporangium becharense]
MVKKASGPAGRQAAGPERPPLSRELILRRALATIDESGVEALSIRRLAADLGVFPTALYYYLPTKDAVLRAVVETVLEEMDLSRTGAADWREHVRTTCRALRRIAHAHPRLFPYLISYPDVTVQEHRIYEGLYRALEEAGLSTERIVHAATLLFSYAAGFTLAEVTGTIGAPTAAESGRLSALPAGEFPATRRLAGEIRGLDLDAAFETGIETILAGLTAPSAAPADG